MIHRSQGNTAGRLLLSSLCFIIVFASFIATPIAQESPSVSATGPAQPQPSPTTREKRAQAYAKLLEGQRFYTTLRGRPDALDLLQRAQLSFRQAIELDPGLAEAHTALAEIALFFLDDLAQAEREAEAAGKINPNNLGAFRILAQIYSLKSNFAEGKVESEFAAKAVKALKDVIRIKPNDAEAWALLSELHLAENREAEAIEALTKWSTIPPPIQDQFFKFVTKGRELTPDAANARLAEVYLRAGKTKEAIAAIRRAIAMRPEKQAYLGLLGQTLEAADTVDPSVVNELRFIVSREPKNSVAVGVLARVEARDGRIDQAIELLRAGIAARQPNEREYLSLRLQLAETYAGASRFDEAVEVYEQMLKERKIGASSPASERDRQFAMQVFRTIVGLQHQAGQETQAVATIERLRTLIGTGDARQEAFVVGLYRSLGRRAEALAVVRDARGRYPDDASLLRLEAITLAESGRVDDALQIMRGRLKGVAGDYDEYVIIASLLMNAGRGAEAVEAARKAIALVPANEAEQNLNALLLLSSAQERAGDPKGSEDTLRKILEKDPQNATALNNLGYFLTDRNERLNEALDMIQRAVKSEPGNPSFLDSLGWVYFKLGKLSEAERYLRDAARRNPGSATIQDHLGDLLNQQGKRDQARVAWQKALSLAVESGDSDRIKAKLNQKNNK